MKLLTRLVGSWLFTLCFFAQVNAQSTIPTIQTFIKSEAQQFKGMFNIYLQTDKYYMQIPDRLLGRDILTSITIIGGSAQRKRNPAMRFGFAGDAVGDQVINLRKTNSDKIEIILPDFIRATDSTNIYFNTIKAQLSPGFMVLDIVAADSSSSLVDITKLFSGDNEFFSLKSAKDELKLGPYEPEKSKIIGVSCFENNIVFRSVKSYGIGSSASAPIINASSPGEDPAPKVELNPTLWEVGASWYLLPEKPMAPRYFDKRVGFFKTTQRNYDKSPDAVDLVSMANRWRIEPKPADVEKYMKGELVEPEKPVVFYIDRNTPSYLIPYIISGVNEWQKSFEKIGFKNAVIGKLAPTAAEDPNFSMEDARYSYISYKPSEVANAYGPQVVDPRSGEILSSHVAVFHSILELLQRWYFSMCAANDPQARKFPYNQDLMGNLLKNVITHEVGHTLGLRHNFAGSSSFDVDSIRRPDYVRKNSFGPSVMDYMRFNYVAQPQDHFKPEDLLPKIGAYDDFAIDWGYRYRPEFTNAFKEKKFLSDWVSETRRDRRFFYIDEGDFYDPRVQAEDVGNNNMKANRLGMENLKITMANLEKWTVGDDEQHNTLRSMYRAVEGRYYIYLGHVLKNIGGVNIDYALRSEKKSDYRPVSYEQQKEAMAYFKEAMFTEPKWLYPKDIMLKTRVNFDTDVEETYSDLFGRLLLKYVVLTKNERLMGAHPYRVSEFLSDLHDATFSRLKNGLPISEYDQMLQRTFVNKMLLNADNRAALTDNISVEMIKILEQVKAEATSAAAQQKDLLSKSHLISIVHIIDVWQTGTKDSFLHTQTNTAKTKH